MQRNFFVMLTLSFMLLFSGCGGGGSTQQNASSSEALKIEVTLPTQNQKSGVITQKSTSDILSMFLTVLDDTNATVSRIAMVKNGDVWSVSLVINPDEGPFTFRADAYDVAEGSVTASTTPIFAGSSSYNPQAGVLTTITLTLEEVTDGEVTTRILPYVASQTNNIDVNGSLNLVFNIRNPQGGGQRH